MSTNVANEARIPEAAASVASVAVASVPAAASNPADADDSMRAVDERTPIVQEMVMNGFELSKVIRAVELVGDNFDDLLPLLMSNMAS